MVTALDLTLVLAEGAVVDLTPSFTLVLAFAGVLLPPQLETQFGPTRGRVSSGRELSRSDVVAIAGAAGPLVGVPRLETISDTSDVQTRLGLFGRLGEQSIQIQLGLMASGFRGEHAGALRVLLGQLLTLGEVAREHHGWRLCRG
jgi:hypothetical protein